MAEEKTIIIKNSDEEKKSNFTFKNYLSSIKMYRYWILGVSLLVAIFAYLITILGINKNFSKVSSSFSYSFETESYIGNDVKLLDGSSLSINSIISRDTIKSVYENTLDKDGNKAFEKLNIDDIIDNSNISLVKEENKYETTERKSSDPVSIDTFTLAANIKPFKNEENARLFVQELIESLPKNISELYNQKVMSPMTINDSDDFYQSVYSLSDRYTLINKTYGKLISKFSEGEIVPTENKSLIEIKSSCISNLSSSANITYINQARSDLLANGYINNFNGDNKTETLALLNNKKGTLETRYNDTVAYKERLKNAIDSYENVHLITNQEKEVTVYAYEFESLISQYQDAEGTIASIQFEKDLVDKQIEKVTNYTTEYINECKEFNNQIKKCNKLLNNEAERISKVRTEVFLKHTNLTPLYSSPKATEVVGSLPPVLIGAAGLVLGFVVSSLIDTYIYINKHLNREEDIKKEKKEKTSLKA